MNVRQMLAVTFCLIVLALVSRVSFVVGVQIGSTEIELKYSLSYTCDFPLREENLIRRMNAIDQRIDGLIIEFLVGAQCVNVEQQQ